MGVESPKRVGRRGAGLETDSRNSRPKKDNGYLEPNGRVPMNFDTRC